MFSKQNSTASNKASQKYPLLFNKMYLFYVMIELNVHISSRAITSFKSKQKVNDMTLETLL